MLRVCVDGEWYCTYRPKIPLVGTCVLYRLFEFEQPGSSVTMDPALAPIQGSSSKEDLRASDWAGNACLPISRHVRFGRIGAGMMMSVDWMDGWLAGWLAGWPGCMEFVVAIADYCVGRQQQREMAAVKPGLLLTRFFFFFMPLPTFFVYLLSSWVCACGNSDGANKLEMIFT